MLILRDESAYPGTPIEIVRAMQQRAWGLESLPVSEYIQFVASSVWRFYGQELQISAATDEERARALVSELVRVGLARWSN